MTWSELLSIFVRIANSKIVLAVAPAIASSVVGALTALFVFWLKSREPLRASIVWRWDIDSSGFDSEEPFLAIQNRSDIPAFIIQCRLLKGNFIETQAAEYALTYGDPKDPEFPLIVKSKDVSIFPISRKLSNQTISEAYWYNKFIGYIMRRPFLWIEIRTLDGRKIAVPANESTDFHNRPLWIDLRWFPKPKPI